MKAIDCTVEPGSKGYVKILEDPADTKRVITVAQADKFISLPSGEHLAGPKTVRITLDNTKGTNAARLGSWVYYEKI